jgi:FkbM family methyltransferase
MTFRPLVLSDCLLVLASRDKEPYVQKIFKSKSGETVVDIGAHIGFYTLKAARDVGQKGTVIAIEPDPQNFLLLKKNIAINHFHNTIAINAALSDHDGQRLFYTCADPSVSGFQPSPRTRIKEALMMTTMTLDELLRGLGINRVDWIKIDAEGEELRILKGSAHVLQNNKKVKIIIEAPYREVLEYLTEMGFHTEHLGEIYYLAFKD